MRWDNLRLDDEPAAEQAGPRPLLPRGAVTRTFDTPEFRGLTFHEVTCRSALNKVPDASPMPFRWTVNPYRGCSMACTYCLAGDTLVLMADGSSKSIQSLRPGDRVIGTGRGSGNLRYVRTEVVDHWTTVRPAVRVTMGNGTSVVASPDHRFLTDRGWKHVLETACGSSGQRPHLTSNNFIRGVGSLHPSPKVDEDYRRGYLTGMIRGDGHLRAYSYRRPTRSGGTVYRFRLALKDNQALLRSRDFLARFGVATTPFDFTEATSRHAAMSGIRASSRSAFQAIGDLVSWPSDPSDQWCLGYLAGLFDAEGSHSRGVLRVHNSDDDILDHAQDALARIEVPHVVETVSSSLTAGMRSIRIVGGLAQRLKFLQMTDPAITRKRRVAGLSVRGRTRVVAVEPLGFDIPMYDITTGTGDFVANGLVSHNCFARKTHEYLDLDSGTDFETQIVVKTNVGEVLRRELRRPSWAGEHVAMGTNVDCYQRAEGRYRLMRDIIPALTEVANPFSILTKGALILRDLDLLTRAAEVTDVSAALSIGSVDRELRGLVEPGAPPPRRRLEVVRRLTDAGIPTGVLMAPVLPHLSDSDEQIDATVAAIAASGATYVSPIVLHLRPGAREWWTRWLRAHHPELVVPYARLYRRGSYADPDYQADVTARVRAAAQRHGVGRTSSGRWRTGDDAAASRAAAATETPAATQLSLL